MGNKLYFILAMIFNHPIKLSLILLILGLFYYYPASACGGYKEITPISINGVAMP